MTEHEKLLITLKYLRMKASKYEDYTVISILDMWLEDWLFCKNECPFDH